MIRSKSSQYSSFDIQLEKRLNKIWFLKHLKVTREFYLLVFFCFLFFLILLRLFFLQVLDHKYYDNLLNTQHVSQSLLKAERGNIFAYDKSGKPIQLTENISLYTVYADPKFIWDKPRFIDIMTPVVYKHLCEIYGMKQVDKVSCIKNVEAYTNTTLFPQKPDFFYYGWGIVSTWYRSFDETGYQNQIQSVITGFTQSGAYDLIKTRLDKMIQIGIKPKNYLGFFVNEAFLKELKTLALPYITIENTNYVYIVPTQVNSVSKDSLPLQKLLVKYWHPEQAMNIQYFFKPQENRYVKLIVDTNPVIAQTIKDLKLRYYQTRNASKIPLLHSVGLEEYTRRYYQYGSFLSNVLGMVDKNGTAFYGVEQYFDSLLRGKNGKIIWRSSSWVGNVWANDFQIEDVINGNDIYLTIDLGIQKEIENVAKKYQESLKADSVSILVYDPFDGSVKWSANYPSFDPNNFNSTFELMPLDWTKRYVLDDLTYLDVPVYVYTGWTYSLAKTYERTDPTLPKYIAENMYGPRVFVDKNIAMPYEPGSIFKAFTMWIALDLDEISLYDFYNDTNEAKVGQYTIKNADPKNCAWTNNFLHAFVYSCNVWMVKIVNGDVNTQVFGVGKESYYNYLDKLWFGKLTNIELAGESEWFVDNASTVSVSRFLNNAFGQGILTTPIQIAAAYTPIVNSGYYIQPTIVKSIFDTKTKTSIENKKKVVAEIFRPQTSILLKQALFSVLDQNKELKVANVPGYRLGGKSWTSQISYKGKYQQGIWWTNASFVGTITSDNPRYLVIVQVRRPRSSIWGSSTAAKIFGEVAQFLVNYSLISK